MDCELSLESDDAGDEEDEAGGEATKAASASPRARRSGGGRRGAASRRGGATNLEPFERRFFFFFFFGAAAAARLGLGSDPRLSTGPSLEKRHSPCGSFGGGPEVVLVSSEVATGAWRLFPSSSAL